jgi:hypothetical protein
LHTPVPLESRPASRPKRFLSAAPLFGAGCAMCDPYYRPAVGDAFDAGLMRVVNASYPGWEGLEIEVMDTFAPKGGREYVVRWPRVSLCKLFGVNICALFGVTSRSGPTGSTVGRRPRTCSRSIPLVATAH